MALLALADYVKNNRSLWKTWEYSGVLLAGLLGAFFGAINDQITCSISPEYFHFGKEIEYHSDFRLQVAMLGAKAGFFVGFVVFGLYLYFARSKRGMNVSFYKSLFLKLRVPLIYALTLVPVTSILFVLLRAHFQPDSLLLLFPESRIPSFYAVWGWHHGLYIGAVLGTVHGIILIRRSISSLAERPS